MNKEQLKNQLKKIDIHSYCNPLWNLYISSPENLRDVAIEHCVSLDYSNIKNKYSYFKKSFDTFLTEHNKSTSCLENDVTEDKNNIENKLTNFLIVNKLISSFNYKTYLFSFKNLLEKYDEEVVITAFDYSFTKLIQMTKIGDLDETKKILNPIAYFMKSLEINALKCTEIYLNHEEVIRIKKKLDL